MIRPFKFFLRNIWKKIRQLFAESSPSSAEIISEQKSVLAESLHPDGIYSKLLKVENEVEKEILIKQIARQEVAGEILELVKAQEAYGHRHKIKIGGPERLELHELRNELQSLKEQKALLTVLEARIKNAEYPDLSLLENRIKRLQALLPIHQVAIVGHAIPIFEPSPSRLDKLFADNSVVTKYKQREYERDKQEQLYKNQLRQKLSTLEMLLDQNRLDEAKSFLIPLTKSIKPFYQKELNRLARARERLKEKELRNLKKKEEEFLKRQAEEARRLKVIQDQKDEQQRILREKKLELRRIEEQAKGEKERKLNSLLIRKFNWRDFQKVLQENGIKTFYHFTDSRNLKSIKENNGLYSWYYADSNGIVVNFPGGDTLSRDLDKKHGLHDYVRVSFCPDHPMQYRLQQSGRTLVLLEVSIDIAYYQNTIFCNINATDSNHQKGSELKDLERIRFSATKKRFVRREDPDFKHHQAEVLVKTWIPLSDLTNITNFV